MSCTAPAAPPPTPPLSTADRRRRTPCGQGAHLWQFWDQRLDAVATEIARGRRARRAHCVREGWSVRGPPSPCGRDGHGLRAQVERFPRPRRAGLPTRQVSRQAAGVRAESRSAASVERDRQRARNRSNSMSTSRPRPRPSARRRRRQLAPGAAAATRTPARLAPAPPATRPCPRCAGAGCGSSAPRARRARLDGLGSRWFPARRESVDAAGTCRRTHLGDVVCTHVLQAILGSRTVTSGARSRAGRSRKKSSPGGVPPGPPGHGQGATAGGSGRFGLEIGALGVHPRCSRRAAGRRRPRSA